MNELQILAQRAKDLRKEEKLEAITKAQEYRDWLNSIRKAKSWKGWKSLKKFRKNPEARKKSSPSRAARVDAMSYGIKYPWEKRQMG